MLRNNLLKQPRVITATNMMFSSNKICGLQVCQTIQADRKRELTGLSSPIEYCYRYPTEEVSERLIACPHKSLQKTAQKSEMSCSSYRRAAETLEAFPYKVHAILRLLPPECEKHFICEWFLQRCMITLAC
jgi:hypothetical protein